MATRNGTLAGDVIRSDAGAKGRFVAAAGAAAADVIGTTTGAKRRSVTARGSRMHVEAVVRYRLTVWDSGLGARVTPWTDTEASLRAAPTPVGVFGELTILASVVAS